MVLDHTGDNKEMARIGELGRKTNQYYQQTGAILDVSF